MTKKFVTLACVVMLAACATSPVLNEAPAQPVVIGGDRFIQDVSWSPDAKWIAFSALAGGEWGVYVAKADGTGERRLTPSGTSATWTTWSPDGKRIATALGPRGRLDIATIEVATGAVKNVTSGGTAYSAPAWSPDGADIAFTSAESGKPRVMLMHADGTNVHELTHGDSGDWNPQWSPDGTRLVFYSPRGAGSADTFCVVNRDGTGEQLLDSRMKATFPSFTPAGGVLFTTTEVGDVQSIVERTPIGGHVSLNMPGFFARMAPDGKRIAVIEGKYPKSQLTIAPMPTTPRP